MSHSRKRADQIRWVDFTTVGDEHPLIMAILFDGPHNISFHLLQADVIEGEDTSIVVLMQEE